MKVVIIGGGAAGMVAAIKASRNNEVTIIEKNKNVGKKILITGNGKCNYFNDDFAVKHYNSKNLELLDEVITEYNKEKVLDFFDKIGVIPKVKNGYYYPLSNQAVSIQNILLTELKLQKVEMKTEEIVLAIEYKNKQFLIKTDKNIYKADKVILATGSKAGFDTIYDDIGYKIAASFGHTIIPVLPGLVQLKGKANYFKEWSGIRCDAAISLFIDDKLVREEIGELQLTNYGISGICTMQLSNYAVPAINFKKDVQVKINFLNSLNIKTEKEFINFINKRNSKLKDRTLDELFDGIVNYKLVNLILKLVGIKNNNKLETIKEETLKELAKLFIAFPLRLNDFNSYKDTQICLGGVSLNEVNLANFESKKQEGLFIIGELLDVNGDCGGYNLGFAWLSGILAGESIGGKHD